MADFKEVMRQRQRMCDRCDHDECASCPIEMYADCMNPPADMLENYEAAIMRWAAEHPEPQYPTWEEWQKEQFPDARFPLSLCHFIRSGVCPIPEKPFAGFCETCRKQPIPAEIAEKLGIKPRGVEE